MQIFAKGQWALFVQSQSGHRHKQMEINILGISSPKIKKKVIVLLGKQQMLKCVEERWPSLRPDTSSCLYNQEFIKLKFIFAF